MNVFKTLYKKISTNTISKIIATTIVFICTVFGGLAAWPTIQNYYFSQPETKSSPLQIFYPPVQEAQENSLLLKEKEEKELHVAWNVEDSLNIKPHNNCFRFEFSILNTTGTLQSGMFHLAFKKSTDSSVSQMFDMENDNLFCEVPVLNTFIMDDPYERSSIIRSERETDKYLIVNYKYKDIPPNKDIKLHFYLSYIPNTVLEIKNETVSVVTNPIYLNVEVTAKDCVYKAGNMAIFMHVNTGISSMLATVQAFAIHFIHKALENHTFIDRLKSYIISFVNDTTIETNRLILIPKQYLLAEFGTKKYLLATTEGKIDSHFPWQIANLLYKYENDKIFFNPTEMPVQEFISLRNKLLSENSSRNAADENQVFVRSVTFQDYEDFENEHQQAN